MAIGSPCLIEKVREIGSESFVMMKLVETSACMSHNINEKFKEVHMLQNLTHINYVASIKIFVHVKTKDSRPQSFLVYVFNTR